MCLDQGYVILVISYAPMSSGTKDLVMTYCGHAYT